MSLNDRISKIIEYSELSFSEFADEVDVQRSSISHITSGRNKPSLDLLIKVKDRFPELQWEWMITGKGDMLKKEEPEPAGQANKVAPTALPDLFSLIDDEDFGYTESEDRTQKIKPIVENRPPAPELSISDQKSAHAFISDSQRLEKNDSSQQKVKENPHQDSVKRIVLFYESGRFESFEP